MPKNNKKVTISFVGEDKLGAAYRTATMKMNKFAYAATQAGTPLKEFGEMALKVEGALALLAGATLVYATAKFQEFETEQMKLTKVLDKQNLELYPAVKDKIRDLSNEYGVSSAALTTVTTDWVKSGEAIESAGNMAKLSVDLYMAAAEAEFDISKATNALIRAKKGYNLTTEETIQLANQWNYTANNNATSVEFLSDAFARVSRQSKDAGFSMEELNGYLTPMIEVFQNAEQPATAFKSILAGLQAPTGQLADGLDLLNIDLQKNNGEWKTARELFIEVGAKMATVDDHTRSTASAMIAGKYHVAKMATAWAKMGKSVEISAAATSKAAQESLGKEVAKTLATGETQIKRWQTTFDNAMIDVGEKTKAGTEPIISGATDINIAIQGMVNSGTFKEIFDEFEKFGVDAGKFLEKIAKDLPDAFKDVDFSGLLDSFGDVKQSLIEMFDVDITTPKGLTTVIQSVIDTLESLQHVTAGTIRGITPFISALESLIGVFNDITPSGKELIGALSGVAMGLLPAIAGIKGFMVASNALLKTQYSLVGALKATAGGIGKVGTKLRGVLPPSANFAAQMSTNAGVLKTFGQASAAFSVGFAVGTILRKAFPILDKWAQKIIGAADSLFNFTGQAENMQKAADDVAKKTQALNDDGSVKIEIEYVVDENGVKRAKVVNDELAEPVTVSMVMDTQGVSDDLSDISDEIEELGESVKVSMVMDSQKVSSDLAAISSEIDKVTKSRTVDLTVGMSDKEAVDKLKEFEKQILKLDEKTLKLKVDSPNIEKIKDDLADITTYKLDFAKGVDIEFRTGNSVDDLRKAEFWMQQLQNSASQEMRLKIATQAAKDGIELIQGRYEQFGTDAEGNPIMMLVDNSNATDKIKELDDTVKKIPHEKLLEIKLQGEIDKDIARIKAQADAIQTTIEWEAKLKIAQAQADMERFKASTEATSKAIEGAGGRIVSLYGQYDQGSRRLQILIEQQAEQERKIQLDNHRMQMESLAIEQERNKLINEQLRTGKGGMHMTISENIEPIVVEVIKSIVELVNVELTGNGVNMLYG